MANFSKAFNFRGGFQVDTDVLVVRGQNVGIASTIPNERLVVNGIIQANGLNILSTEAVELAQGRAGILTVTEILDVGIEKPALLYPNGTPQVRLTTGIITAANPAIGVVTYYGDGGRLLNLPTSQWLDVDVGLGFTSIYAQGYVGVNTDDPRFVFQVGGVPFGGKAGFITSQIGVGIESGSIWASRGINAGGEVSIGDTLTAGKDIITTDGEFIGVGSNITLLRADNLGVGSIPSTAYGDLIITKRVIADNFTGIASTAVSVLPDSILIFDQGEANIIDAKSRFISTEGKLQIGSEFSTDNNIAEIDVNKVNARARIVAASDNDEAYVVVGKDRPGDGRRKFGGIRWSNSNSPGERLSGPDDLDLVNYDVGSLNFYLHSGNGGPGVTTGSYRFIYGQTDTVLMDLDRFGTLTLPGSVTLGSQPSLVVTGIATIGQDFYVGQDLRVKRDAIIERNLIVDGELTFGTVAISTNITIPDLAVTNTLTVGGTNIVMDGVAGSVTATSGNFGGTIIDNTGLESPTGTVSASDLVISNNISAVNVSADTYSGSGGFIVDVDGNLTANAITGASLDLTEFEIPVGSIGELSAVELGVSGTATINIVDATLVVSDSAQALELLCGVGTFGILAVTDTAVINSLRAETIDIATPFAGASIGVLTSMTIQGDISVTGNVIASNLGADEFVSDTITVGNIFQLNPGADMNIEGPVNISGNAKADTFFGKISCKDFDDEQYTVSLTLEAGFEELTILVTDANGIDVSRGTISMTDLT
jgi:hypothetical protein